MLNIMRNCNIFADGISKHLEVEEITLPKLADAMQDYRGGGMDATVDVMHGMEKMEAGFKLSSFDKQTLGLFGLRAARRKRFIIRGAIVDDIEETVKPAVAVIQARLSEASQEAWKAGDKAGHTHTLRSIIYYKLTMAEEVVHEIDVVNSKRIIFGEDQMAEIRAAIGL